MKFNLTFCGGTGSVTGANFLLEGGGKKILVDCGMTQGSHFCEQANREPFPYDPATIDALFITHAHIDHTGRIPKLVREGFQGAIYSTPPTKELAALMLEDSIGILGKEAQREGLPPLYEKQDVERALALWETIEYHTKTPILGLFSVYLKDAGHILGSAIIELTRVGEGGETIAFTGDLGNSPSPLLRASEPIEDAKYVLMESVYGDRLHENIEERTNNLREVIIETMKRGGVLMVPAFSIERTQVMLYELNKMVEGGEIPQVPIYLDSPLAIAVTGIYQKHIKLFNKERQNQIIKGDDVFDFPGLEFTNTPEESHEIDNVHGPKVIIAGAGMSHGGRIQRHEQRYLSDPKNALLLVGYQAAGSMGRRLQDGAKEVVINKEKVKVRAQVKMISGYSAHKDRDALIAFAEHYGKKTEQVFVAMGEPKSSLFLAQRLRDYLDLNAVAPKQGEVFAIEL